MIIDLERFAAAERPYWSELEGALDRMERDVAARLDLPAAERLYYLSQRAAADLARVATFSAEPGLRRYLEGLVARAYGQLHDSRTAGGERRARFRPWAWFAGEFPRAVRRHWQALALSIALTLLGAGLGGLGIGLDYEDAKETILPGQFSHLNGRPSERVAREERAGGKQLGRGGKAPFSTYLMANNIGVSIKAVALGLTWGIGTIVLLFYNGVILGAVVADYVLDGQGKFVAGWLLPHGSVEIPSILLAGQAGLVLGGALLGWGRRERLRERLRAVGPDVVTLIGGVAVLLVWAGLVEAFFSQYHEPVLPYALKIGLGGVELAALVMFLTLAGRRRREGEGAADVDARSSG